MNSTHTGLLEKMARYQDLFSGLPQIATGMNAMLETFANLGEQHKEALQVSNRIYESMSAAFVAADQFGGGLKNLASSIQNAQIEFWLRLHEGIEEEQKVPESLVILAGQTWYLDEETKRGEALLLAVKINNMEVEYVNRYLVKSYKKRIQSIMLELADRHQNRREIFEEIEFCRKRKKFYAAITVLLSQIDGICYDLTNAKFFEKSKNDNYITKASVEIKKTYPYLAESYFAPIMIPPDISKHETVVETEPDRLNRHRIMHGVQIGFATELNFYKCLSLLKYVSDVLMEVQMEKRAIERMKNR